jgi:hypothetical protein
MTSVGSSVGPELHRRPPALLEGLGVELVAELGGHQPVLPVVADGGADERLGQVVAVAFGGVDQVDAEASGSAQQLDLMSG